MEKQNLPPSAIRHVLFCGMALREEVREAEAEEAEEGSHPKYKVGCLWSDNLKICAMIIRNVLVFFCCAGIQLSRIDAQDSESVSVGPGFSSPDLLEEPTYLAQPKYCLIKFGRDLDSMVWMIEDGERLFVDKNGNGNLTDDGEPLKPNDVRDFAGGRAFNYSLNEIKSSDDGSPHTGFVLRRWNHGDKEDSYGLSVSVNGRIPMYSGWFGTFWSEDQTTAPVIKLSGPFRPVMLRRSAFQLGGERSD